MKTCEYCQKKFVVKFPQNKNRFCSLACRITNFKKYSFRKGNLPWIKGKKHTTQTLKKISSSLVGRISPNKGKKCIWFSGKNNPKWAGGLLSKKCILCGNEFYVYKSRSKSGILCSSKCRATYVGKNNSGKNNVAWKGNNAGYVALHTRVKKVRGIPKICEYCGTTTTKRYEWASKTKKYCDINDYIRLCKSCHNKLDVWKTISLA